VVIVEVMRAIVFGAGGTLGQALVTQLPASGYEVAAALGHQDCSITNEPEVRRCIRDLRPDVIFNAAAYTDVDGAESDGDGAYQANAVGPEVLARACEAASIRLVHYSTDFVFDGESERPYDEFDPPSPQGVYARSKLAGERLVQAATRRAFVLRVGCLYGRGGRNFPSTILRRLRAGETVRADRDRIGSPTWVVPVTAVSAALARTEHYGLYHCTANGETSWADYARFLADELGLPAERVAALPTGSLSLRAPRPRRAVLDNRMLRLRGLDTLGDWQTQARAFMSD
jgi:dTDP-4-dehydrorhamnose reductase